MKFSGGPAGAVTEHLWHLTVAFGEGNRPDWLFSSANQCTRRETAEVTETTFCCSLMNSPVYCIFSLSQMLFVLTSAHFCHLVVWSGISSRPVIAAVVFAVRSSAVFLHTCSPNCWNKMPEPGRVCEGERHKNVLRTTKLYPTFFWRVASE